MRLAHSMLCAYCNLAIIFITEREEEQSVCKMLIAERERKREREKERERERERERWTERQRK